MTFLIFFNILYYGCSQQGAGWHPASRGDWAGHIWLWVCCLKPVTYALCLFSDFSLLVRIRIIQKAMQLNQLRYVLKLACDQQNGCNLLCFKAVKIACVNLLLNIQTALLFLFIFITSSYSLDVKEMLTPHRRTSNINQRNRVFTKCLAQSMKTM